MVSQRIRVLMVDDHPLLSEGLAAVIQNQPDMIPVCQASSGREAIQLFEPVQAGHHTYGSPPPGHEWHRRRRDNTIEVSGGAIHHSYRFCR